MLFLFRSQASSNVAVRVTPPKPKATPPKPKATPPPQPIEAPLEEEDEEGEEDENGGKSLGEKRPKRMILVNIPDAEPPKEKKPKRRKTSALPDDQLGENLLKYQWLDDVGYRVV